MFKVYCASFAAAMLAATAAPALSQSTTASANQAPANAAPVNNPNEIVCEKQETTGSRIGARRVCMSRAEWADRKLQDRQELERVQVQRGTKGE